MGSCKDKALDQGVDNVHFHIGPFDDSFTTFTPGSLDAVCAYSILHLIVDRPAALARIYDLLKPGGFFVSSTVCLGGSWVPYAPLLTVMRWLGKAPRVWIVSRQRIKQEMLQAGFVGIEQLDVGAESTIAFMTAHTPR